MFDKDGDGSISEAELGAMMRSVGRDPTSQEIKDMIHEVDINENGLIDFCEFQAMMQREDTESDKKAELMEAFKLFDQDGDGKISFNELRHFIELLGENLTEVDYLVLMRAADKDKDGFINLDEFLVIMDSM
ncbi:uncharacterized protein LOC131946227 [Physella acuta]|uniref:uncharacterized protein LOC131946227 n=1 Tax=Physella acuta TaxID=109671 RepID=UPI0027DBFD53|nr:uncharacterized protein LOC131946227 [Physella acuta]